jgi:hypothetical protein
MKGKCSGCAAYNERTKECRRHAPVMVPIPQSNMAGQVSGYAATGLYPASPPDGWCLEFEPAVLVAP